MNYESAFDQNCFCGRTFLNVGAFRNHQNSCKKNKNRLSLALSKAKEAVAARNRNRKATTIAATPQCKPSDELADHDEGTAEVRITLVLNLPVDVEGHLYRSSHAMDLFPIPGS
jgi:hypothetical protein